MDEVKKALDDWAEAIEGLEARRSTAQSEARGFPGDLERNDPAYDRELGRINGLIDGVVRDYDAARDTCVSALEAIKVPIANEHGVALGLGSTVAGYYENVLGQIHYGYKKSDIPTFSRREFLRGLPNLAQGLDPTGRPARLELPEPDFNRTVMTHTGADADGNRLKRPKGLRLTGGALSVIGAGFTMASERSKAEERLLQENPHISEEELENEVGQEALVRTGSTVATAALIGAGIGSVVPGAGTLVGAGIGLVVGIGVSLVLDQTGIQDKINDGAMWVYEKVIPESVQEGVGEVGDFVGDLVTGKWGELFD